MQHQASMQLNLLSILWRERYLYPNKLPIYLASCCKWFTLSDYTFRIKEFKSLLWKQKRETIESHSNGFPPTDVVRKMKYGSCDDKKCSCGATRLTSAIFTILYDSSGQQDREDKLVKFSGETSKARYVQRSAPCCGIYASRTKMGHMMR